MSTNDNVSRQAENLARDGKFEELRQLLSKQTSIDSKAVPVIQAFLLSAFSQDRSLIEAFIDRGISINSTHKSLTVLHIASKLPNSDFIKFLIAVGA